METHINFHEMNIDDRILKVRIVYTLTDFKIGIIQIFYNNFI